jgi:ribosomal RNA assembly protein
MDKEDIKIPEERIAVLIGKNGEIKKKIEERMNVRLTIDSAEGDVTIESEDSVAVFNTLPIIKAIARGFNPEIAELLFQEDYMFDLLNIMDYISPTQKHMKRIKGRIIGREGKARKMIEKITDTNISVYGKTIGIIGKFTTVPVARHALEMLLEGAPHGNVFKWLENKQRELMRREFEDKEPL